MAKKGLGVAVPPPRRNDTAASATPPRNLPQTQDVEQPAPTPPTPATARKGNESTVFDQSRGTQKVQMNISVDVETRNAFQIMAIKLDRKAADLFAEAVGLLEEKYGTV